MSALPLKYEEYILDVAIKEVQTLLESAPPRSKARDFYHTMQSVLMAMEETLNRMQKENTELKRTNNLLVEGMHVLMRDFNSRKEKS